MFYSETLLAKTGPLARVWLSANVERKLSKSHVLSSNIGDSVHAIVDRGQAPLALRLSGQLLLGVVRIYSRKARYLLDDCNEAILKIKMAFRPGNVDLPANQTHTASAAALNLPDVLTEVDLLGLGPDPALLLTQDDDPSLLNFDVSQPLDQSMARARASSVGSQLLVDSQLDFGSSRSERPIEVGRRDTRGTMQDDDTILANADDMPLDDMGITFDNLDDPLPVPKASKEGDLESTMVDQFQPEPLGDHPMDVFHDALNDAPNDAPDNFDTVPAPTDFERQRDSQSPLSEPRASVERDLERSFHARESELFELDEASVHQAQRVKKRKLLHPDADTVIHSEQIRNQMNNPSKILKPASYLPRDPVLLTLMEMQKSGAFVSNIIGDGRSKGWAPELRGVLSLEVVRGSNDLKRKRDSGIAGVESEVETSPGRQVHFDDQEPHLEIPADEDQIPVPGEEEEEEGMMQVPADDDAVPAIPSDHDYDQQDNFDETTMPLLHPDDAGPVSLGTKHAVHMLRDKYGSAAETSPGKRLQATVLFTDICPEKTTTRADATKMFFETLVLATKDAVKVDQEGNELGAPMKVRAKRGLWGNWAEMAAGGEIEAPDGQTREEVTAS